MKVILNEKPQKVTIIEGFPGVGFVSTIAIEFLTDHMKFRSIGKMWCPELAPIAIVHGKRIIQPIEILYNEKFNLVVLEALAGVNGFEWEVADAILELYKKLNAKELISIEGIATVSEKEEPDTYSFSNDEVRLKMLQQACNCQPIKEGVIMGVSGALLVKLSKDIRASFIFSETHSKMPDNKAAAKIIEALDKYLNLDVDYKPLLRRAGDMEEKIRGLLEKSKQAVDLKRTKDTTPYIG
ncbi:MAG TPA: proteasome assembly chaperone family protein [Nanoarchaeota archaeon]|nr:proteasome assembly chaperone family protein [Nanoarchaeota archaeon]